MSDAPLRTSDDAEFPVEVHEGPVHVLRNTPRGIGVVMSRAPLITAVAFLALTPISAYLAIKNRLDPMVEILSYIFPPFAAAVLIGGWWHERRKLTRYYFDVSRRELRLAGPAYPNGLTIAFDSIETLQVIPGGEHRFKGAGTKEYTIDLYELNVVVNGSGDGDGDGDRGLPRRVNLQCHGNPKLMVDDAQAIADRTGLPLSVSPKVPKDQVMVTPR